MKTFQFFSWLICVFLVIGGCSNTPQAQEKSNPPESEKSGSDSSGGVTYVPPTFEPPPDPVLPTFEPPPDPVLPTFEPPPTYVAPTYEPPNFNFSPPTYVPPDVKINSGDKKVVIEIPEHILFDYDSSELRKDAYPALAQIAKSLKETKEKTKDARFRIDGHTDNKGSKDYNLKLSLKRAEAVKKAFINEFKLPDSWLEVQGFGETRPLVKNDTPSNQQKNRRVEVTILAE